MKHTIILFCLLSSYYIGAQAELSDEINFRLGDYKALYTSNLLNFMHGDDKVKYFAVYKKSEDKVLISIGPNEFRSYELAKAEIIKVTEEISKSVEEDLSTYKIQVSFKNGRVLFFEDGKFYEH